MGTIVERKRKNGTLAYMAKISIMREGVIAHRENKTFDRRPAAAAWIAKREEQLSQPGEIERAKSSNITLADAIDKYTTESLKEIGRTKAQVLRTIKEYPIANLLCERVTSQDIVGLAKELSAGKKPQTVSNYISHLSAIFAIARPAWDYRLDPQAIKDATVVAKRLGLISKSDSRDRRPTLDELDLLMTHFQNRNKTHPKSAPMDRIIAFALFSTRRQEEITRIKWDDLDEKHSRILVRDMKHPGQKVGNDTWCDLPEPALRIIKAMTRASDTIFPYSTDAISAAFTRACPLLAIEDLTFHDLRHEGISRLFEMGMNIPHAAAVSGHRSWVSLKRYTHMKESGDKYDGWKWLDAVTQPLP
ncbi:site-specific integrase [Phyllobacterium sp. 628]|uniref:site-specific integrase n=1 Tax=Phyllobacterium sp. 628 TaxID=2718938 RepID=UPI0016625C50|nr:site-specific integrase [Phyllobacterium sp. 628]QND53432.1 site-specific integrase [Phyllobacterium sp. 628]